MTAVVPFPRPAPPYDPAKRGRLQPGQDLPQGIYRLFPTQEPPRIALTPERALLAALAGALPSKVYTALLGRLRNDALGGSMESLIALRIATGDL